MTNIETARVIALNLLGDPPIEKSAVQNAAQIAINAVVASNPNADVDLVELVRELEANLNVVVGNASTLTDEDSDHVPWLSERRGDIDWNFSRRYQRFLKEKQGWPLSTILRSDDLTDRILGLLEDPNRHGQWGQTWNGCRRGSVGKDFQLH